jgi:hypothetical protein
VECCIQRELRRAAASLALPPRARGVDENPSHQSRRHGEAVCAILPAGPLDVDEVEVGLVNEGRGLQRVRRQVARHTAPGRRRNSSSGTHASMRGDVPARNRCPAGRQNLESPPTAEEVRV